MMRKVNPEIQEAFRCCLQEIKDNLKAAGYKERDINKAIDIASHKVLLEIRKECQRERFAKLKATDEN